MEARTRTEAITLGHEFYYTGKPCKWGHDARRRASNGVCIVCHLGHEPVTVEGDTIISRKAALAQGLPKYYTGKPCKHGHIAERYAKHGTCVMCTSNHAENFRNNNRERFREIQKKHRKTSIRKRLSNALRCRVYDALKRQSGNGSAVKNLGCTVEELKLHLESQFSPEMTWENWGSIWQIDHIQPLLAFNLADPDHLAVVCHYTNLQPLLIEEHRKKTVVDLTKSRKSPSTLPAWTG